MAGSKVKKVIAVCFLEAAKTVLDQLGQYRMEMTERGLDNNKDFPQVYGDVRRLRDYMQRCVSAFPDTIELDLEPRDVSTLVACCRRAVETIDHRVESGQKLADQERDWLQRKRQVLSDWAVDLASKPLLELPLPRLSQVTTTGMKALHQRLNTKLFGPQAASTPIGFESFRGSPGAGIAAEPPPEAPPAAPPAARPRPKAPEPVPEEVNDINVTVLGEESPAATSSNLVDVRQVRDPRLRSLMALDLRAHERAIEAKDHRLAAVHLASILEGAILDHAIPRRAELGLHGAADSWNPQEILLRVLGDTCAPKDRSFVFHVFAARNMLRPSTQLVSPTVVTSASLDKLTEFVARVLNQMGFLGQTDPMGFSGADTNQFGIPL
jgi:hypothetical protein